MNRLHRDSLAFLFSLSVAQLPGFTLRFQLRSRFCPYWGIFGRVTSLSHRHPPMTPPFLAASGQMGPAIRNPNPCHASKSNGVSLDVARSRPFLTWSAAIDCEYCEQMQLLEYQPSFKYKERVCAPQNGSIHIASRHKAHAPTNAKFQCPVSTNHRVQRSHLIQLFSHCVSAALRARPATVAARGDKIKVQVQLILS